MDMMSFRGPLDNGGQRTMWIVLALALLMLLVLAARYLHG
jgi:hypothetical protein